MRNVLLLLILFVVSLHGENEYQAKGKHFIATFRDCDSKAVHDSTKIQEVMEKAINKTGANLLYPDPLRYDFTPQGTTQLFLLSVSHASIHTYPDKLLCFVDLFTCGDHCHWEPFYEELRAYFKTENVTLTLLERSEEVQLLDAYKALQK